MDAHDPRIVDAVVSIAARGKRVDRPEVYGLFSARFARAMKKWRRRVRLARKKKRGWA